MLTRTETLSIYKEILETTEGEELRLIMRELCKTDLFFLLTQVCKREDVNRDWLYDRCREVESEPDFHLDLWARNHYKSTIITFGLTIREILNNPNITICILSYNKGISKGFLGQLMREFENNELLKELFSEIFYQKPNTEAQKWSINEGIIVKRSANPKEGTIESYGLVDGQPVGRHYNLIIYDDIVNESSVGTVDQIEKTNKAFELSLNLFSEDTKFRICGTRYHHADTYSVILERNVATSRIYPATDDGTVDGKPVLYDKAYLEQKKEAMGNYVFSAQLLLNPVPDDAQTFQSDWLQYYSVKQDGYLHLNRIIICDPANSKKKYSDWTAIIVVGLGRDENYYVIDIIRDKFNLTERANILLELHLKYKPYMVYYEQYGMVSDIHYIQEEQRRQKYRFPIVGIKGNVAKVDRIKNLIPICENNRLYLPYEGEINHRDYEGKMYDPVKYFVDNEYLSFPFGTYDDVLDAISRIADPQVKIKRPGGTMKKSYVMSDYNVLGR